MDQEITVRDGTSASIKTDLSRDIDVDTKEITTPRPCLERGPEHSAYRNALVPWEYVPDGTGPCRGIVGDRCRPISRGEPVVFAYDRCVMVAPLICLKTTSVN